VQYQSDIEAYSREQPLPENQQNLQEVVLRSQTEGRILNEEIRRLKDKLVATQSELYELQARHSGIISSESGRKSSLRPSVFSMNVEELLADEKIRKLLMENSDLKIKIKERDSEMASLKREEKALSERYSVLKTELGERINEVQRLRGDQVNFLALKFKS
jgi:chromosome segregation ATPase